MASSFSSQLPALLPETVDPTSVTVPLLIAVLSRLNEPDAILELFDAAVDRLASEGAVDRPAWASVVQSEWDAMGSSTRGALVLAVRSREALLKSFPLVGFPLTISALTTLATHLSKNYAQAWTAVRKIEVLQPFPTAFEPLGPNVPLHEPTSDGAPGGKDEVLQEASRGRKLFNSIYGKVAGRVIESLRWGHPNLVDCALKLIYTPVLSDVRILTDPLESSLLCLVLCFASDLPPQTKGHFRGAQNLGARRDVLEPLLKAVWTLVDWAPAGRLRVDRMEFLKEVGIEEGQLKSRI